MTDVLPRWLRLLRAYGHYALLTRGKWRLVLWAFKYLEVPDMVVDSTLDHALKVRLQLRTWVDFNIYCLGLYEHYLATYFKNRLQADTVFLDVGAYIGQYSLLEACTALKGQVYAFEPHPESAKRLREAATENHLPNIEVVQVAVGEHSGSTTFDLAKQPFQSSVVASHAEHRPTVMVPITSLDQFRAEKELARVDIVKVDVEEAEDAVIRGARTLLQDALPLVIIAIGGGSTRAMDSESIRQLKSLGYDCFTLVRTRILPLPNRILPSTNVIAIPNDQHRCK